MQKKRLFKAIMLIVITILLDVIIIYIGVDESLSFHLGWAVGSVGFINFFSMILLTNILNSSESTSIQKEHVRKAIATSFITTYFIFLALLSFEHNAQTNLVNNQSSLTPILSNFTYLVGVVIVFYFASGSVSEYIKYKSKVSESESQN